MIGILFTGIPKRGVDLQSAILIKHAVIAAALCITVFGFMQFWLARRALRPLNSLTHTMQRISEGDYASSVPGRERQDQVGAMAAALQVLREAGEAKRRLEQQQVEQRQRAEADQQFREAEASREAAAQAMVVDAFAAGLASLAKGDLTYRLAQPFSPQYERLRTDYNEAADRLQDLVRSVAENTAGLRASSGEIAQAADNLSRRTEQQAASLEQTAAALDQITATVRHTAEGARQASQIVSATRAGAEASGAVVQGAVAAMAEIDRSSQQIGQIIGVIDELLSRPICSR